MEISNVTLNMMIINLICKVKAFSFELLTRVLILIVSNDA